LDYFTTIYSGENGYNIIFEQYVLLVMG